MGWSFVYQLLTLGICAGATLSLVGPAPLFMAFCVMSMIISFIMNAVAELVVFVPLPGASVPYYINRFFEPSLAFACGWNYWSVLP